MHFIFCKWVQKRNQYQYENAVGLHFGIEWIRFIQVFEHKYVYF